VKQINTPVVKLFLIGTTFTYLIQHYSILMLNAKELMRLAVVPWDADLPAISWVAFDRTRGSRTMVTIPPTCHISTLSTVDWDLEKFLILRRPESEKNELDLRLVSTCALVEVVCAIALK
jgi:hypothetical protein